MSAWRLGDSKSWSRRGWSSSEDRSHPVSGALCKRSSARAQRHLIYLSGNSQANKARKSCESKPERGSHPIPWVSSRGSRWACWLDTHGPPRPASRAPLQYTQEMVRGSSCPVPGPAPPGPVRRFAFAVDCPSKPNAPTAHAPGHPRPRTPAPAARTPFAPCSTSHGSPGDAPLHTCIHTQQRLSSARGWRDSGGVGPCNCLLPGMLLEVGRGSSSSSGRKCQLLR